MTAYNCSVDVLTKVGGYEVKVTKRVVQIVQKQSLRVWAAQNADYESVSKKGSGD